LQLPPVLESFAARKDGLAKTLFIRLSTIGFPPLMLRTQYRVHRLKGGGALGSDNLIGAIRNLYSATPQSATSPTDCFMRASFWMASLPHSGLLFYQACPPFIFATVCVERYAISLAVFSYHLTASDCVPQEERAGKSYHNPYELTTVVEMVKCLINWDIEPHQIGVIALCE